MNVNIYNTWEATETYDNEAAMDDVQEGKASAFLPVCLPTPPSPPFYSLHWASVFFTIAHWDEGSRPAARAHARQACLGSVVCVGTHLCVSVMCEHVRVELRGGEWSMLPRGRGGETGGDCLTWSVSSRIPFPQSQSIHSVSPISSLSRPRRSYHDSLSQLCILKVIRLTCERTLNAQRKKKWICYRCNYIHSSVAVLKAAPLPPLRLPSLPIVHAFFSLHLF